jgi:integrase
LFEVIPGFQCKLAFLHEKKHPVEMGAKHIEEFLTHLAVDRNVSASTQNQALNALIFLFGPVTLAMIHKSVGCHSFRHSFATHLLAVGSVFRRSGHATMRTS